MTAKSRKVGPALRSRPGLRGSISKIRDKIHAGRPHLQQSANPRINWPAAATALAAAIPRERLDPAGLRWAEDRSWREGWAVACSGGPDSLALLLLLWAHWPARRRALRALHFDHRL